MNNFLNVPFGEQFKIRCILAAYERLTDIMRVSNYTFHCWLARLLFLQVKPQSPEMNFYIHEYLSFVQVTEAWHSSTFVTFL